MASSYSSGTSRLGVRMQLLLVRGVVEMEMEEEVVGQQSSCQRLGQSKQIRMIESFRANRLTELIRPI